MSDFKEQNDKTYLGFWLYIMTDLMLFAAFFACFMILRHNTNGGPAGLDIFDLTFVLTETVILLSSTYLCALAYLALKHNKTSQFWQYLIGTIVLGVAFLALEVSEFAKLLNDGDSWQVSAFLSSFFALVGLHGLHILVGLIWGITLAFAIKKQGVTKHLLRKFGLFAMFWHFLDIVWIFIFTIVYVLGVI